MSTWDQAVEARGIGGFARSLLIAFGGVSICIGIPILWMILTLPGRSDMGGDWPVLAIGLLLTVVGLPIVGALCASDAPGVAVGGLVGLLSAVAVWAAAGTAASDEGGTQRIFADFLPSLVIMAVVAVVLFMIGFFVRRRMDAQRG